MINKLHWKTEIRMKSSKMFQRNVADDLKRDQWSAFGRHAFEKNSGQDAESLSPMRVAVLPSNKKSCL